MRETATLDSAAATRRQAGADPQTREVAPNLPAGLTKGLRNYWYPVLQSEELPDGKPVGFMALGESLVAWRDATGKPCVVRDRCPHRSIKLSVGHVHDGKLQCILHGLRFDGEGRCVLIPWDEDEDRRRKAPAVAAYPARELGGYVWCFLADTQKFPPPALEQEVPEELTKPDEFIWFRLPTEVWRTNWLLAVDGSDAFHAVVLHASSQAVTGTTWTGGQAQQSEVPLSERRMKIVKTSHGIRGVALDAQGRPLHHGHFTVDVKGDRFVLPCLHTNPIQPAPGAVPYTSRLWQFAIDEQRTQIVRYAVWRAHTPEEREKATRVFNDLALPRLKKVSSEDAFAAEAQGDVITARREENLMAPDIDVVNVRRLIRKAFLSPLTEQRRIDIPKEALLYPL
ncbi:MAG TPA: Rieske 2Fe-2S domain-containing protein [Xanthobacteraceae bacterium]|jgi:phenylpropionate dioxygenase-like ring-hydroxylating dioxygenase large terminal subunit